MRWGCSGAIGSRRAVSGSLRHRLRDQSPAGIRATHLGSACLHPTPLASEPVGAENLIRRTNLGRCPRKNAGTCRATYVPHSVAPAVRKDPDGDLEILVSDPIGVFGTHTSETDPDLIHDLQ